MTRLLTFILTAALVAVPGCRQEPDAHRHGEAAHDHAKEELPTEAVTVYTPKTELFAEHRMLVAGHETRFAAHLTDLRDWSPLTEGRLEAVLMRPNGSQEVFTVDRAARPGIFQPVVKPSATGTYMLEFRLTSGKLTDTIQAGEVTVYSDVAAAQAAAPNEESNPDEISYLKEQQWKVSFMSRPVDTAALEAGVMLQGTVKPAGGREVAVTAPSDGRVVVDMGRQPRVGDRVGAGQLLAVLTPTEGAMTDRAGLREAVQAAEANLRQARLDLSRVERLVAADAVPGKRLEEARTAHSIAQARLEAARHHLRAKEASLTGASVATEESFYLKAPLAGTVIEASLVPGAHVEGGAALYRLVDLSTVWVEARVPEAEVNRLANARRAEVQVAGAPTVTVGGGRGGLVTIGSVLDPATRTAPVVYAVPNPTGAFRIGMTARVRALTGSTQRSPVVPASAVVDDNGRPIAYVQTGGESFERRVLQLGVWQGDRVQVLAGLKPGDRVVTNGGYEIRLSTLSNAVPAHGHEH